MTISLLIIFYATALYNDVSTSMHVHCVKVLASNIASLTTVAKQSLEMFNSAHCIHEQLSILMHF